VEEEEETYFFNFMFLDRKWEDRRFWKTHCM